MLLVVITMFWGASCLLTKFGLGGIQEFNLIALRFVIAFILASLVFSKKVAHADVKTIKFAAILGGILFIVLSLMTFGVKYTSASNAGFLTCLAAVFIPIIALIFMKQIPEKKVLFCICMTFLGVYLLTVRGSILFNIGDLLCILCSVAFAVHIIVTGALTKAVDSITLGLFQIGFVGIYSLVFSIIFEKPKLPATWESWMIILALGVFCSAFAFIAQTVAQKNTTPTHTGLIFSLEPLFAALFAFVFAHEVLSTKGYIGGIILVVSILLVEIDIKNGIFKNRKPVDKLLDV